VTNAIDLIVAAKNGDQNAFEAVVKNNSPLIWSIVRRFLGRGTDADDLYQLGCLGLLKAVKGFDEKLGNQFSTYAVPKIIGEIRRFLRDDGTIKVSRTIKERAAKIAKVAQSLSTELNREPTLSEISEITGFTVEEISQAECATISADSLNREIGEDGQTVEDLLAGNETEDTLVEYLALGEAIDKLSDRERLTIYLRYFKCMTQTQTAKRMGISQVQVSRLERRAIQKLRTQLIF